MRIRPLLVVAALAAGLYGNAAMAQRLGVVEVPPWAIKDASGAATSGIGVDVAKVLKERTGLPIEIQIVPFARMSDYMRSGELDFALTTYSQAGEAAGPYVADAFKFPLVVVARPGIDVAKYEDLKKLGSVGIIRGSRYGEPFDSDPEIKRSDENSVDGMLRKLAAERLDGVAGSAVALYYTARQLGQEQALGKSVTLLNSKVSLQKSNAFSDQAATDKIAKALADMSADGTIAGVLQKYIGSVPGM
ncbi:MAG TPA: transporter substrate-binding domain-containing protein [Azospirillaceae bacterium]|nr:transporter substrate-binding domain-containing protein [Azospirillaceae bacterium]